MKIYGQLTLERILIEANVFPVQNQENADVSLHIQCNFR